MAQLKPESGLDVNPLTGYVFQHLGGMAKKRLATIIKENVRALRELNPDLSGQRAFAKACGVGEGTIWRIDNEQKRGASPETLESIAQRFKLEPWHLLIDGLDPRRPPELAQPERRRESSFATPFEEDLVQRHERPRRRTKVRVLKER